VKTTIFLLALYGVFGFFACKREDAKVRSADVQIIQDQQESKSILMIPARSPKGNNEVVAAGLLFQK